MARWTIQQACLFLAGFLFSIVLLGYGGYLAVSKCHEKKIQNEKYQLVSIVQTGPEKEALKTDYLAELLGLSIDRPISVYAFDCKAAEKHLLSSPLIKSAFVKRMPPRAIYVDYEIRKPVAMLGDYKNVAIDERGYLFPFAPFFSPKEIPEVYLNLPPFGAEADSMGRKGGEWLVPLEHPLWDLALSVLRFLQEAPWREGFRVKRIDVSNALAPSLGQREIVLFIEETFMVRHDCICTFPKILRVAPKDFMQQLTHFFALRRNMEESYRKQLIAIKEPVRFASRIIDLRIPQLAFVQNQE